MSSLLPGDGLVTIGGGGTVQYENYADDFIGPREAPPTLVDEPKTVTVSGASFLRWDTETGVELRTGDWVRAEIDIDVLLPNAQGGPAFLGDDRNRKEVQRAINARLESEGLSTRVKVQGWVDQGRGWMGHACQKKQPEYCGWVQPYTLTVTLEITHNFPILATALVLIIVAAIASDAHFNNGKILTISGQAVGTFLTEAIQKPVNKLLEETAKSAVPLVAIVAAVAGVALYFVVRLK